MSPIPWFWLGALALNTLWVFLLPNSGGRGVALLGVLVALVVLARGRTRPESTPRPPPSLALVFALPACSFGAVPRLAFWALDGRGWLILAWLAAISCIEVRAWSLDRVADEDRPPSRRLPAIVGLFAIWTSVFWLSVVEDAGVKRIMMVDRASIKQVCQSDPLTTMISIWESAPASAHLFLGWRSRDSFNAGLPYANHAHPYLLTMYGWIAAVRMATGVPLFVATNSTPFFYMLVLLGAVTLLLARIGILGRARGPLGFLLLFLAIGTIVTAWRFWGDLYRYNNDNPYPLLSALLVATYASLFAEPQPRVAVWCSVAFVAMSPIHTPMLIFAVICLFGKPGGSWQQTLERNRLVIRVCLWALVAGLVAWLLPRTLIALKGYQPTASTMLFRSGLDGDTTYFSNIAQAFWAPCPGDCCYHRPAAALFLPAILPLAVFGPSVWRDGRSPLEIGKLLLFLCTPYAISVIAFPQSVSIHPYLYDHLLLVPFVVVGAAAMLDGLLRARLTGAAVLSLLLFMAAVIMSNLIALAQRLAAIP